MKSKLIALSVLGLVNVTPALAKEMHDITCRNGSGSITTYDKSGQVDKQQDAAKVNSVWLNPTKDQFFHDGEYDVQVSVRDFGSGGTVFFTDHSACTTEESKIKVEVDGKKRNLKIVTYSCEQNDSLWGSVAYSLAPSAENPNQLTFQYRSFDSYNRPQNEMKIHFDAVQCKFEKVKN